MARLVWTLPDGQQTARWAEDEGGGDGFLPDGGTTRQVLRKESGSDGDVAWASQTLDFNVKDFRETGDPEVGTHSGDVTSTLQAACDAAEAVNGADGQNPTVFFPGGDYYLGSTLHWKKHHFVGEGMHDTRFWWIGAAHGLPIDGGGGNRSEMRHCQFRGAASAIDCWVWKGDVDIGDNFENVYFSQVQSGGDYNSALYIEGLTNFWMHNCRWELGSGYGVTIEIKNSGQRYFGIRDFTLGVTGTTPPDSPGFIHLKGGEDVQPAANLMVHVSGGRIESDAEVFAADSGFIVLDGHWSTEPTEIHLADITAEMNTQSNDPVVIYKGADIETTVTPNLQMVNCSWQGFSEIFGGTANTSYPTPTLGADAAIGFYSYGRKDHHNALQGLRIGGSGIKIHEVWSNYATYDPPSLNTLTSATTTISVPGAVVGHPVMAGFTQDLAGVVLTAYVSAADTVTCVFFNATAGTVNLASGALRAVVMKIA